MLKHTLARKIAIGLLFVLVAVVSGACQDDELTSQELSSDSNSSTTEDSIDYSSVDDITSDSSTTEDSVDYSSVDDATSDSSATEYSFDYSWAEENLYIAHAMGGVLGITYTNSYEAFLLNYSLGLRVFEADFSLTEDNQVVLLHELGNWESATINGVSVSDYSFTYNNFKSSLLNGQFHTLSLEDLLELMVEYPDIYIVTDTKGTDTASIETLFTAMIEAATEIDASLPDRMILQIYNEEMLDTVMDIYTWKSVIYTLYADPDWTDESVAEFMTRTGVNFITMWGDWSTAERISYWKTANPDAIIASHTINDLNVVEELQANGVDLIYTDFLTP